MYVLNMQGKARRLVLLATAAVAATLAGGDRAGAQGVWHLMYYNDPFGGMGRTLAEQELLKAQVFALNAGRQAVMASQATQAYQAANLLHHQAVAVALSNAREQAGLTSYRAAVLTQHADLQAKRRGAPLIPAARLLGPAGAVLWPRAAFLDRGLEARRVAAEEAIRAVVREVGAAGRATGECVTEARARLAAFGRPALVQARARAPRTAASLLAYLRNLDAVLVELGEPDRTPAPALAQAVPAQP